MKEEVLDILEELTDLWLITKKANSQKEVRCWMYWNTFPFFDSDMAEFVCRKCGWRGYELETIKTDDQGNELPINEWYRGCPRCNCNIKYIELED